MNSAENHDSIDDNIKDLLVNYRDFSLHIMKSHSQLDELKIEDYKSDFSIPGHWMTFVQVSTDFVKIIFKNYFFTKDASEFSCRTYNKKADEMLRTQILDFSKEYCNLMGGQMKWFFERQGHSSGQSMPLLMKSFDEIYFLKKEYNKIYRHFWSINYKNSQIINSVGIEITNPEIFGKLKISEFDTNITEGQLELL